MAPNLDGEGLAAQTPTLTSHGQPAFADHWVALPQLAACLAWLSEILWNALLDLWESFTKYDGSGFQVNGGPAYCKADPPLGWPWSRGWRNLFGGALQGSGAAAA